MPRFDKNNGLLLDIRMVATQMRAPDPSACRVAAVLIDELTFNDIEFCAMPVLMGSKFFSGRPAH